MRIGWVPVTSRILSNTLTYLYRQTAAVSLIAGFLIPIFEMNVEKVALLAEKIKDTF